MTHDPPALYRALAARDARFDGVFYVGVTSTGIYCRPVCPAKTPKATNCRFFDSAAAAERAAFRPCLRCRPELAPGRAPVDDAPRVAGLVARRIEEGASAGAAGLARVAARFGYSPRQLRRIVHQELGVAPMELVLTRRLLLAKQLLTETALPVTRVATASGFSSLRRFNDAFRTRYGMPPTRLRRQADGAPGAEPAAAGGPLTLQLAYRPPFDWDGLLRFLRTRALRGVEHVGDDSYARTVQLGGHAGWLRVRHAPARRALVVELAPTLTPVLPDVLARLRHLFDLSARPDVIAAHLAQDPLLADAVARAPGLRVPGAFDGFELAVRAVLGQQVSVAAAATLAGRFAAAFGAPVATPHAALDRLTPTPARVAAASADEVAALGVVRARAAAVVALAGEVAAGRLTLDAGDRPDDAVARLCALPGVGPWTAQYVAMRALRWPDAFPKEDLVVRRRLGGATPAAAEARSRAWRPWRAYATLHLWRAPGATPDASPRPAKTPDAGGGLC
jgi:AraC family transcriptional regulator of adaptative response / DNA-3-methyladenine glycosylase II